MKNLYEYILEHVINEGGAAGHMRYPHNYTELTFGDLSQIIEDLLSGKIEDVTEKIDGMNIQATKNEQNEVVFIRNKTQLNSERGGMLRSDIISKWDDKPHVLNTFSRAASTIEKVLSKIPSKFFNHDGKRIIVNCECVVAGTTNIVPYVSNQVDFHDLWIYEQSDKGWIKTDTTRDGLDVIEKACKDTEARLTPKVIIDITKEANAVKEAYLNKLKKICPDQSETIEQWMRECFETYCHYQLPWVEESQEGMNALFRRFFLEDKSTNLRLLRKEYSNSAQELEDLVAKGYKKVVEECNEPLDNFFVEFGTAVIRLCKGIINQGREDEVVKELISQLNTQISNIKKNGTAENIEMMNSQMKHLEKLGLDNIAPAEGIVFKWKGRTMKLTGGFSSLNQIMGIGRFNR